MTGLQNNMFNPVEFLFSIFSEFQEKCRHFKLKTNRHQSGKSLKI